MWITCHKFDSVGKVLPVNKRLKITVGVEHYYLHLMTILMCEPPEYETFAFLVYNPLSILYTSISFNIRKEKVVLVLGPLALNRGVALYAISKVNRRSLFGPSAHCQIKKKIHYIIPKQL